ncbi:MAG: sigma-70 family RNA polymerase sigma factor [Bacteroidales bacterium]|nr:sigma-70 family RNA polymerase sigma factor [Bacteroidales bacterium]
MLFSYSEEEMKDLILRIYPRMISYIQTIVHGSVAQAEDLLSNTLTKMLEKKPVILSDKVEGYLFRAVRNECLNLVSRKTVERDMVSIDQVVGSAWELLAAVDFDDSVASLADMSESGFAIDEILKVSRTLNPRTRDIFHMSRIEGMSQEEIASELGISVRAVQKHLKYTVDEYRKYYKDSGGKPS